MRDTTQVHLDNGSYQDRVFYTGRLTEPFFQRHFHSKWSQRIAKVALYGGFCTMPLWLGDLWSLVF